MPRKGTAFSSSALDRHSDAGASARMRRRAWLDLDGAGRPEQPGPGKTADQSLNPKP